MPRTSEVFCDQGLIDAAEFRRWLDETDDQVEKNETQQAQDNPLHTFSITTSSPKHSHAVTWCSTKSGFRG